MLYRPFLLLIDAHCMSRTLTFLNLLSLVILIFCDEYKLLSSKLRIFFHLIISSFFDLNVLCSLFYTPSFSLLPKKERSSFPPSIKKKRKEKLQF